MKRDCVGQQHIYHKSKIIYKYHLTGRNYMNTMISNQSQKKLTRKLEAKPITSRVIRFVFFN